MTEISQIQFGNSTPTELELYFRTLVPSVGTPIVVHEVIIMSSHCRQEVMVAHGKANTTTRTSRWPYCVEIRLWRRKSELCYRTFIGATQESSGFQSWMSSSEPNPVQRYCLGDERASWTYPIVGTNLAEMRGTGKRGWREDHYWVRNHDDQYRNRAQRYDREQSSRGNDRAHEREPVHTRETRSEYSRHVENAESYHS